MIRQASAARLAALCTKRASHMRMPCLLSSSSKASFKHFCAGNPEGATSRRVCKASAYGNMDVSSRACVRELMYPEPSHAKPGSLRAALAPHLSARVVPTNCDSLGRWRLGRPTDAIVGPPLSPVAKMAKMLEGHTAAETEEAEHAEEARGR